MSQYQRRLILGIGVWKFLPAGGSVALADGWNVEPVGNADYSIIDSARIRLEHGELLVFSDSPTQPITIETTNAEATAAGTKFYVGAHQPSLQKTTTTMNNITRILVLSGIVSLTTDGGSATGNPNSLLAAENANKPVNIAVRANSDFAIDLYQRLAAEDTDANLFFSPFSISSAIAMVADGARGKTAEEMGRVLRFPEIARRIGDDAQRIPWEIAKIHAGISELNRLLNAGKDDPKIVAIRERIATLQNELAEAKSGKTPSAKRFAKEKEIVAELNPLLTQIDQYELKIANALWVAKNFPFREEFLKNIADSYGTGAAMPADFAGNAETERERINQWIVEKTGGHIKDALPPDSIEPLTRLIISNAIYFNGQWAEPFPKRLTEKRDFFTAPEISSKVDIMRTVTKIGRYGSFEADGSLFNSPLKYDANNPPALYSGENGFAVYEMPYKGDEISMVIIAPNKINGLTDIEKSITADNLSTWISKLSQRETDVLLPKFEVNTGYSLNKTLIAMGMSSAFGADADFSGMTNTPTDIYISEVIHKAFIKVNEEGTEAAAVTAVLAVGRALPKLIDFTPEFRADRPFLYLIRDKRSGSILFMGRITQPEA